MRHRRHLDDNLKSLEHESPPRIPLVRLSKGNYRWRKSDLEALERQQVDRRKVDRRNGNSGVQIERRAADRRYADRRSEKL